jgi:hypothetical protein
MAIEHSGFFYFFRFHIKHSEGIFKEYFKFIYKYYHLSDIICEV